MASSSTGRGRGRGRPRKPRETRMDAAVDAMTQYGFEEKFITKTVKELLKVYGGAEAWPLIEDGCYNTVLEVLLKKNAENNDEGGNQLEGGGNQLLEEGENQLLEEGENQLEQIMALEPHADIAPVGNTVPPNDAEPPFSDITDTASATDNTGMEESHRGNVYLEAPANNFDLNLEPDINLSPTILPPQPTVGTSPNQRRQPCYGWISDDDEYDDLVYTPYKAPEKPSRKSRWDVGPAEN